MAILITNILNGCRAEVIDKDGGQPSNNGDNAVKAQELSELTVSEMLKKVMEDNGGEVNIYTTNGEYDENGNIVGKDTKVRIYAYDGIKLSNCNTEISKNNYDKLLRYIVHWNLLGELVQGKTAVKKDSEQITYEEIGDDFAIIKTQKRQISSALSIRTDQTGNYPDLEVMYRIENNRTKERKFIGVNEDAWSKWGAWGKWEISEPLLEIYFGAFSRIEVYNKTFMCFTTIKRSELSSGTGTRVITTLIEDTDFTKNKSIILDPVGKTGVAVDEISIDDNYQAY